jgi:hypothetical protein
MLLGGHDLPTALTPQDLIPGSVDQIDKTIAALVLVGVPASEAADALPKLGPDVWTGPAADAFRAVYAPQPPLWASIGTGLSGMSDALKAWRNAVQHGQGEAWLAKGEWQQAKGLTDAALATYTQQAHTHNNQDLAARMGIAPAPPPMPPFHDPGASLRQQAERRLAAARLAVGHAEDTAIVALAAARGALPEAPDALHRFGDDFMDGARTFSTQVADAGKGAYHAVTGMVNTVRTINPLDPNNVTHPAQYAQNMLAIGKGVAHDVTHPLETFQSMADSTAQALQHDPGKFIGELLPSVAVGALTDGAGDIAAGAAETASAGAEEATGLSIAATETRGAATATAGNDAAAGTRAVPPSTALSPSWGAGTVGADAAATGGIEQAGTGLSQVEHDLAGIHLSEPSAGPATTPPDTRPVVGAGRSAPGHPGSLAPDPAGTGVAHDPAGPAGPPTRSVSRTAPSGNSTTGGQSAAIVSADQAAAADLNSAAAGLGTVERDLARVQVHPQAQSPGLNGTGNTAAEGGASGQSIIQQRLNGINNTDHLPTDFPPAATGHPRPDYADRGYSATPDDYQAYRGVYPIQAEQREWLAHIRAHNPVADRLANEELLALDRYKTAAWQINKAMRSGNPVQVRDVVFRHTSLPVRRGILPAQDGLDRIRVRRQFGDQPPVPVLHARSAPPLQRTPHRIRCEPHGSDAVHDGALSLAGPHNSGRLERQRLPVTHRCPVAGGVCSTGSGGVPD